MQQLIKYANLLGLDKKSGWRFLKHRHRFPTNCQSRPPSDRVLHSYTTSQLARYATVLASSGNVYNLSLLDKSTDSDGNLIEDYTPEMIDHVELSQGSGMMSMSVWRALSPNPTGVFSRI